MAFEEFLKYIEDYTLKTRWDATITCHVYYGQNKLDYYISVL